ncbi:MAG: hypothetical protein QOF80_508 [Verrucomicrobiota bacterium]|jgi:hypothetical protein
MTNKTAILLGAFGGVAPNLVRLLVNYSSPNPQPVTTHPVYYCLAMLGFAVVGGLITMAFRERNWKRALFIGVGLPAMFQVGALQSLPSSSPLPPSSAPPMAGTEMSFSLISSAYAQPPPDSPASVPGRKIKFTGDAKTPPYTVAFYGPDNKLQSTHEITNPASQTVDVPATAAKFALQLGESTSPSYALAKTASATIKAEVKVTEKAASGFLQGVGLAKGKRYEIAVSLQ